MASSIPIVILCGGLSSRMGQNKASLRYQGQSLISRQVANALPHRPVWLAAADERYVQTQGATYLPDALSGREGPLSALASALAFAAEEGKEGCYVMSCDTLLLPEELVAYLASHQMPDTILTLSSNSNKSNGDIQHHPLFGYWPSCESIPLMAYLLQRQRRVMCYLENRKHQAIKSLPQWHQWLNFNTPEEFSRAKHAYHTHQYGVNYVAQSS